jgi:ABC-type glycerol-3-phosphate transport system substrate-binding protein
MLILTLPKHFGWTLLMAARGGQSSFRGVFWAFLVGLLGALGCGQNETATPANSTKPSSDPSLVVLFVGEEDLAEAVSRRWSSEGHPEMKIEPISVERLREDNYEIPPRVDAVLFPVSVYGDLIAAGQLLEIDEQGLSKGVSINRHNFLGHFRGNLTRFGSQTLALPLGSPQPVVFFREDLLPSGPPCNWSDLSQRFDAGRQAGIAPWLEPLDGVWAAHSLLARVAPAIRYRGKISTLFDLNTVEPLITSEPFEAALVELVEQHRQLETREFLAPEDVFLRFRTGQALMAVGWPIGPVAVKDQEMAIGVSRLPTNPSYFDSSRGVWLARDEVQQRVDYLGSEGLLVGVAANSLHANEAIEFAVWLASNQTALRVVSDSPTSGPFRLGHLTVVGAWTKGSLPDEAVARYSEIIRQVHDEEMCLTFPRISRRNDYLQALGEAVRGAISQKMTPQEALQQAHASWSAITEEVGIERQREMLRKTEGLLIGKIEE